MITAAYYFNIAAFLYGMSFVSAFLPDRSRNAVILFLCPALAANAAAVVIRYHQAWPMLPMYLGPVALPLLLGCLTFVIRRHDNHVLTRRIVLAQTLTLALAAALFPKDYYLPFVKSLTVWAHLFFLFTVAGKGCFLVGAARAMATLWVGDQKTSPAPKPEHSLSRTDHRLAMRWTVWGFAFWTLAMFTGEMWSYLGWGTPVVWEDPAITTTMATWFFYICLLHLHLSSAWTARGRGIYTAAGAVVIFVLNCMPELGPFRWPWLTL